MIDLNTPRDQHYYHTISTIDTLPIGLPNARPDGLPNGTSIPAG